MNEALAIKPIQTGLSSIFSERWAGEGEGMIPPSVTSRIFQL